MQRIDSGSTHEIPHDGLASACGAHKVFVGSYPVSADAGRGRNLKHPIGATYYLVDIDSSAVATRLHDNETSDMDACCFSIHHQMTCFLPFLFVG